MPIQLQHPLGSYLHLERRAPLFCLPSVAHFTVGAMLARIFAVYTSLALVLTVTFGLIAVVSIYLYLTQGLHLGQYLWGRPA
ncbi:hypothetical protein F4859DRAFT_344402 [Xylaria cf. heliscus]|nr:hypothetical protein F4859DRAFT_344402 [Xylaria cf. heliscus]